MFDKTFNEVLLMRFMKIFQFVLWGGGGGGGEREREIIICIEKL